LIKPDQIPDEVVEAAARAYAILNEGHDEWWHLRAERARAAIAAAINAWPGMVQYPLHDIDCTPPKIILPLPKEPRDE
jgi:hypothetical protein